jgi:hypothetical protein
MNAPHLDPLICLLRYLRRQSKKNYTLTPKQIETINSTNDPDIYISSPFIKCVNVFSLLLLLKRKGSLLRGLTAIENARKRILQCEDNPLANTTQMINSTLTPSNSPSELTIASFIKTKTTICSSMNHKKSYCYLPASLLTTFPQWYPSKQHF